MRIALVYDLVYPYSKGGVERRIADVADGLAAEGHDVHIFGTKMWDGPSTFGRDGVAIHGIASPTRLHNRSGRRSVFQAVTFALRLLPQLGRLRADIVDVQSMAPLAALAALLLCRLRRVPTVVTWHEVWGTYWSEYLGPTFGRAGQLAEKLMGALGDTHVAVSQRTGRAVGEILAGAAPRLVEGGVDLEGIDAIEPDVPPIDIACVARLEDHKNVGQLISAIALIQSEGAVFESVLVGDGPDMDSLREQARGLPSLRFAGALPSSEDVISVVKGARLFVLPSLREGFGLAVLEALACGVPAIVVAHDKNAARDLVVSGYNGFVVAPGDTKGMARLIEKTLGDEANRTRMAHNARSTASRYPLSRTIGNTRDVYESTIRQAAVGSPRGTPGRVNSRRRNRSPGRPVPRSGRDRKPEVPGRSQGRV